MYFSYIFTIVCISSCSGLKWVAWSGSLSGVPTDAVRGGEDIFGLPLFVIRATTDFGEFPGKYNSVHDTAHVSYGGAEVKVADFLVRHIIRNKIRLTTVKMFALQILTGTDYYWSDTMYGENPVFAGRNEKGDTMHICRAVHDGNYIPGRWHNGYCYISFAKIEYWHSSVYQVLKKSRNVF